jgi:hypothetical protein
MPTKSSTVVSATGGTGVSDGGGDGVMVGGMGVGIGGNGVAVGGFGVGVGGNGVMVGAMGVGGSGVDVGWDVPHAAKSSITSVKPIIRGNNFFKFITSSSV